METTRADELLRAERQRVDQQLRDVTAEGGADRTAANQSGDMFDSAEPLTQEEADGSIAAQLSDRLAAIDRALARIAEGAYGRSVRSGLPIPDERLEADPAAELTVEEARLAT